jgi:hypothetical protein
MQYHLFFIFIFCCYTGCSKHFILLPCFLLSLIYFKPVQPISFPQVCGRKIEEVSTSENSQNWLAWKKYKIETSLRGCIPADASLHLHMHGRLSTWFPLCYWLLLPKYISSVSAHSRTIESCFGSYCFLSMFSIFGSHGSFKIFERRI